MTPDRNVEIFGYYLVEGKNVGKYNGGQKFRKIVIMNEVFETA